jgi:hypothetical protein
MAYDPVAALGVLNRHKVRYVVIGGVAGRLWGSPTLTNYVDICCERSSANLARLVAALEELGARLRGVDDDVPFILDAEALERGQNFTFTTFLGPLDVMGLPAGVRHFDELAANAVVFDLGDGVHVEVCALDDLIRMKRASGRPKDRIELEVLGAVRDEWDHTPPSAGATP